jgi:hypothetical protein
MKKSHVPDTSLGEHQIDSILEITSFLLLIVITMYDFIVKCK